MTLRIISEQELAVRKEEIILSLDDMAGILSLKNEFIRFLNKTQAAWLYSIPKNRGKEEAIHNKADGITEIIASLEATEKYIANYRKEQIEKDYKK